MSKVNCEAVEKRRQASPGMARAELLQLILAVTGLFEVFGNCPVNRNYSFNFYIYLFSSKLSSYAGCQQMYDCCVNSNFNVSRETIHDHVAYMTLNTKSCF